MWRPLWVEARDFSTSGSQELGELYPQCQGSGPMGMMEGGGFPERLCDNAECVQRDEFAEPHIGY